MILPRSVGLVFAWRRERPLSFNGDAASHVQRFSHARLAAGCRVDAFHLRRDPASRAEYSVGSGALDPGGVLLGAYACVAIGLLATITYLRRRAVPFERRQSIVLA
jgi:hypothetical protein